MNNHKAAKNKPKREPNTTIRYPPSQKVITETLLAAEDQTREYYSISSSNTANDDQSVQVQVENTIYTLTSGDDQGTQLLPVEYSDPVGRSSHHTAESLIEVITEDKSSNIVYSFPGVQYEIECENDQINAEEALSAINLVAQAASQSMSQHHFTQL